MIFATDDDDDLSDFFTSTLQRFVDSKILFYGDCNFFMRISTPTIKTTLANKVISNGGWESFPVQRHERHSRHSRHHHRRSHPINPMIRPIIEVYTYTSRISHSFPLVPFTRLSEMCNHCVCMTGTLKCRYESKCIRVPPQIKVEETLIEIPKEYLLLRGFLKSLHINFWEKV